MLYSCHDLDMFTQWTHVQNPIFKPFFSLSSYNHVSIYNPYNLLPQFLKGFNIMWVIYFYYVPLSHHYFCSYLLTCCFLVLFYILFLFYFLLLSINLLYYHVFLFYLYQIFFLICTFSKIIFFNKTETAQIIWK